MYQPTINNNSLLIDITTMGLFSGCYESIWLNEDTDSDTLYDLANDCQIDQSDINVTISIEQYLNKIADVYRNYFASQLDIPYESITVADIYSPQFYNNDTDHIVLEWTVSNIEEALNKWNIYLEEVLSKDSNDNEALKNEEYYTIFYEQGSHIYDELVTYTYTDPQTNKTYTFDYNSDGPVNTWGYVLKPLKKTPNPIFLIVIVLLFMMNW